MKKSNKSNNCITLLICIVLTMFLLGGCSKRAVEGFYIEGQGDLQTFEKLKNEVNINRKKAIENSKSIDISKYTPDFNDELGAFSEEEIKNLVTYKDFTEVTIQEAIEDIETAFNMLKCSYGAYEYFGGDEVFDKSKENIIKKIESISSDRVRADNFSRIFAQELKFIQDGHFAIGYDNLCDYKYMHISSEYVPVYEKGKFYIEYKEGTKAEIISINNDKNLENYIKLTINDNGELCYGLISLFENKDKTEVSSNMVVKYDNKEEIIELKWNITNSRNINKNEPIYEHKIIDGIPVYCIYGMYGDENLLTEFSDSAINAKEEKIFIIDLRGNFGGTDRYADNWFLNYTGKYPDKPISSGFKITNLGIGMNLKESENLTAEEIVLAEKGKWNIKKGTGTWVENENLIIVLIDNNVVSAGEDMIANLRTMENVIFIGSNSAGLYLSAANSGKYLPLSGMYICYGYGIILNNDGRNIDGIGFLPDIWVEPSQSLDLVLKMIKIYNLK